MNTLICPISKERSNKAVIRFSAVLVSFTVLFYIISGNPLLLLFLTADFALRGFTNVKFSPISKAGSVLSKTFKAKAEFVDKAPKIFAARVGFVFSITALILHFISPIAAISVLAILITCALMEAVLDFCVGCVVYTYIVLPLQK